MKKKKYVTPLIEVFTDVTETPFMGGSGGGTDDTSYSFDITTDMDPGGDMFSDSQDTGDGHRGEF